MINRVLPISLYRLLVRVSEKLAIALSWSGKPGSNWRPQPWQGYVVPNYKYSVCTTAIVYSSCNIFNLFLTVPTAYLRPIIKASFLPASKPL
jgi:hypothetical protein